MIRMGKINILFLVCLLAVCAATACPAPAAADDGSQPTVIIDDGSTDTDVPVPPGTTDPDDPTGTDTGNPTDGAPAPPADNPPSIPPTGKDDPRATPIPTETTASPPSYCEATPSADIGVTASSSDARYTVDSMVRYTVDVSSNGPCPAPDAALTFEVPQRLELLSPSAVSASAGDCLVTGGVGSQLITCQFGSLDVQQHASVSVEARADSVGTAKAEAGVSTSVADWNVGDNQRSEVTIAIAASLNQSAVHQRMSQSRETVRAQGLLWDRRTFRSTDEFAGWLNARGGDWDRFEANHPAAAGGLNDRG